MPECEYGPPDWVGVGTMKSGSTWWHKNIVEHPECTHAATGHPYGPPDYVGKQLHFFDGYLWKWYYDDIVELDRTVDSIDVGLWEIF